MTETYDSVLDRIGAFNAATEKLAKRRAEAVTVSVTDRPDVQLRLAQSADHYAIEVHGAADEAAPALVEMGFAARGLTYAREVRKSERSWNVASQLEDVLQDALKLGAGVAISVETN
jgi:hypothetical protein